MSFFSLDCHFIIRHCCIIILLELEAAAPCGVVHLCSYISCIYSYLFDGSADHLCHCWMGGSRIEVGEQYNVVGR